LNFESKTHESQLEDQKPKKTQKDHLEEEKTAKPSNGMKSGKQKKRAEKSLKLKLKLKKNPETNSP
jgi:hypothetical protein